MDILIEEVPPSLRVRLVISERGWTEHLGDGTLIESSCPSGIFRRPSRDVTQCTIQDGGTHTVTQMSIFSSLCSSLDTPSGLSIVLLSISSRWSSFSVVVFVVLYVG